MENPQLDTTETTPIEQVAPNELETPDKAAVRAVEESRRESAQESKPKYLGEFESEEEAITAYNTLKTFAQNIIAQQQEAERQRAQTATETEKQGPSSIDPEERAMLAEYMRAVEDKRYDEAILILKRGIEAKAIRDAATLAQYMVRQELERAAAPHRSMEELLNTKELRDLHPTAPHAVWFADKLGQLGYNKRQVAGILRDFGKKYAAANFKNPKAAGWEEPSGGGWADLDGKDFDIAAEAFWDKQLGLK
ncbi:MAG: hypothetical protein ABWK01_05020 [Infirmifilum sp.]